MCISLISFNNYDSLTSMFLRAQTAVSGLITAMGQLYPEQIPQEVNILPFCVSSISLTCGLTDCFIIASRLTICSCANILSIGCLSIDSLVVALCLLVHTGCFEGTSNCQVLREGEVCNQARAEQSLSPGCGCLAAVSPRLCFRDCGQYSCHGA